MCRIQTLSQQGQTVISQCIDCKVLNLWHNNLLLNFDIGEFTSFKNIIAKVSFDRDGLSFPDGTDRIVLRTPHSDIRFTFSLPEFERFRTAIDEAFFIQEVYAMMK